MTTLPIADRPRFRGLTGQLSASLLGLVAGAGLVVAVNAGAFGLAGGSTASEAVPGPASAALQETVTDLEAFNAMYQAAFERLSAQSSRSALPPPELDELYDLVVARAALPELTLDEINAMFDAAF